MNIWEHGRNAQSGLENMNSSSAKGVVLDLLLTRQLHEFSGFLAASFNLSRWQKLCTIGFRPQQLWYHQEINYKAALFDISFRQFMLTADVTQNWSRIESTSWLGCEMDWKLLLTGRGLVVSASASVLVGREFGSYHNLANWYFSLLTRCVGAGNTPRTQKQTVWNGSRNSTKLSHGAARPLLLLSGNNKPP